MNEEINGFFFIFLEIKREIFKIIFFNRPKFQTDLKTVPNNINVKIIHHLKFIIE